MDHLSGFSVIVFLIVVAAIAKYTFLKPHKPQAKPVLTASTDRTPGAAAYAQ